jgi:peptide deformylase
MELENPVKVYGEEILRQPCVDVAFPNESLKSTIMSMFLIMYRYGGVGLAANQVGISERLAVINCDPDVKEEEQVILINPTIISFEGEQETEEGCLSIPNIVAPRKRYEKIKVKNFDLDGAEYDFECEGLLAIAVQHEIDHLNGKFYTDNLETVHKILIENKLKKLARFVKNYNKEHK